MITHSHHPPLTIVAPGALFTGMNMCLSHLVTLYPWDAPPPSTSPGADITCRRCRPIDIGHLSAHLLGERGTIVHEWPRCQAPCPMWPHRGKPSQAPQELYEQGREGGGVKEL